MDSGRGTVAAGPARQDADGDRRGAVMATAGIDGAGADRRLWVTRRTSPSAYRCV